MDRYEMVENGDQHHNASFIKSVQNLKQPNKTKQKKPKNTPSPAVWSKKQFIGFVICNLCDFFWHHFNLINQDYMKHEVLRV